MFYILIRYFEICGYYFAVCDDEFNANLYPIRSIINGDKFT